MHNLCTANHASLHTLPSGVQHGYATSSAAAPTPTAARRARSVAVSCRVARARGPSLDPMLTYVTVFALLLAYVALVGAFLALRELGRLRRATSLLSRRADGGESVAELVERTREDTAVLAEQVRALQGAVQAAAQTSGPTAAPAEVAGHAAGEDSGTTGALRNVALVRYDAFDDMSGHLSFSLAVLNENGDGVTLSAIAARTDTRVYAKSVVAGKGQQELTPEEDQAVHTAVGSRRLARRQARKAS